jgi:hypothetical protein
MLLRQEGEFRFSTSANRALPPQSERQLRPGLTGTLDRHFPFLATLRKSDLTEEFCFDTPENSYPLAVQSPLTRAERISENSEKEQLNEKLRSPFLPCGIAAGRLGPPRSCRWQSGTVAEEST